MPFFSVVIPTYNRANLIIATLESVIQQTYQEFEIIIVDDGSSDNTKQVIDAKYGGDSRVKYFYKQNEERGAARNYGVKQSAGEYIVFFDSDDYMYPNHLDILAAGIKQHKEVNFIATKHDWNYNGKIKPSTIRHLVEGWYSLEMFIEGNGLACNFCIRKDNSALILFQEDRKLSVMEDWIFLLQNLRTDKLFLIDKVTVSLIDHSERSMTLDKNQTVQKRIYANEWILQHIPLHAEEKRRLTGHSLIFCAVFKYLDGKIAESIGFLSRATKELGLHKKIIIMFFKNILGLGLIKKMAKSK